MLPVENQERWIERYDRFEPVGRNCEFGFVLRNLGSRRSSLFRWTYIEPRNLIYALDRRFSGFFDYRHLAPEGVGTGNTIRETEFKCVLHSAIRSNGDASFDFDEPRLKMLYRIEKAKIDKQISDFSSRLKSGSTICVLAAKLKELEAAPDVLKAIDSYCGNKKNSLLIVTEGASGEPQSNRLAALEPRLFHGRLSRMAPGEAAYEAEFGEWKLILEHALRMIPDEQP